MPTDLHIKVPQHHQLLCLGTLNTWVPQQPEDQPSALPSSQTHRACLPGPAHPLLWMSWAHRFCRTLCWCQLFPEVRRKTCLLWEGLPTQKWHWELRPTPRPLELNALACGLIRCPISFSLHIWFLLQTAPVEDDDEGLTPNTIFLIGNFFTWKTEARSANDLLGHYTSEVWEQLSGLPSSTLPYK